MNVYNIDSLTLSYIRRPVDDNARTELSGFFLAAYNEIYRRIMSETYKMTHTEEIQLDSKRCFSVMTLEKKFLAVKKICAEHGYKLAWERDYGCNIEVHTSLKRVFITYYYMPQLLKNDNPTVAPSSADESNTPVIPEEFHNIFALWAAYRYMHSRRKFDDANYYYEMAMELFDNIYQPNTDKTKLTFDYSGR